MISGKHRRTLYCLLFPDPFPEANFGQKGQNQPPLVLASSSFGIIFGQYSQTANRGLPMTTHADTELQTSPEIAYEDQNEFVKRAMEDNKREALLIAVRTKWAALAVICVLVFVINPRLEALYYIFIISLFALIGWGQLRVGRAGTSRPELLLMFCEIALMTITFLVPNPFGSQDWPATMQYRFQNFQYFYILLAYAVLAYSWRTVVAMGTWTAGIWTAGALAVYWFSGTHPQLSAALADLKALDPELGGFLDPGTLVYGIRIQEVVVFMLAAAALALASRRSNRLFTDLADSQRQRTNLSRYFSPNVVNELASNDEPLRQIRTEEVAVMFVDIVGFTRMTQNTDPRQVIQTLRAFHGVMEAEVFRHKGTLDKYLGDGLMATFGTPSPSDIDAGNALQCAFAMERAIKRWNGSADRNGQPTLQIGIGVHFGEAVLGDIGSHRLEFTVIGSTVNVASRLESLTRKVGSTIVVSDELVNQAKMEPASPSKLLSELKFMAGQRVKGIDRPIDIWTAGKAGA